MSSTSEWEALMRAPWGKFTPEARAAKVAAQAAYDKATELFWAKFGKTAPTVPTGK